MSSNPKMLPPFRDSALTRILKSIFLSNNKATIIVTLDPSIDCAEESLNTIRFARYARRVKTKVIRKDNLSPNGPDKGYSSQSFQGKSCSFKGKLAFSQHVASPVRVLRTEFTAKDLHASRERELMKANHDRKLLKEVIQENSRLKQEIQLLVEKQTKSLQGKSVSGANDEVDSTNSGMEDILLRG